MPLFNVTLKFKDGSHQFFRDVVAKDRDDAEQQVMRSHYRRADRFDLTFARLEQAGETGKPGMLAIDPRLSGKALTEAWVKGETELRKRDQARYEGKPSVTVSEVK